MDGYVFEATIALSPEFRTDGATDELKAEAQAVARAVFTMGGARRVTVVTHQQASLECLKIDQLELRASWDDNGGATWGLREDVVRVAEDALKRS